MHPETSPLAFAAASAPFARFVKLIRLQVAIVAKKNFDLSNLQETR
jgi:hypothetical protein